MSHLRAQGRGLKRVAALHSPACLLLKELELAILPLGGLLRRVHTLDREQVRNSGIAVAAKRGIAVFADGNRLVTVDSYGNCAPLADFPTLADASYEINWEIAANSALSTIFLTSVPSNETADILCILRIDSGETVIQEFSFEYPDSGAYQLDAASGTTAWLTSTSRQSQEIVVASRGAERRHRLTHRYDWMRISPGGDRVLLSQGTALGPIAVAPILGELNEVFLPVIGHTASWCGPDHVAYHSALGSLELHQIGSSQSEPLLAISSSIEQPPGSFAPPVASEDGNILAWSWMGVDASGSQVCGTAVMDLVAEEYRELDSYWGRMAIIASDVA